MTCEQIVDVWRWAGWVLVAIGYVMAVGAITLFSLSFVLKGATDQGRLLLTWIGIVGCAVAWIGMQMVGGTT